MNNYGYQFERKANPCPNCGKEDSARTGSSTWGHSVSCCSEKCGLAIAKKLKANTATKEYKAAVKAFYDAQETMYSLKYAGVPNAGDAIHFDKMRS